MQYFAFRFEFPLYRNKSRTSYNRNSKSYMIHSLSFVKHKIIYIVLLHKDKSYSQLDPGQPTQLTMQEFLSVVSYPWWRHLRCGTGEK